MHWSWFVLGAILSLTAAFIYLRYATPQYSVSGAIMIKDNHIALAGGVDKAMKAIAKRADHMARVSVEVDTHAQLKKVLKYSPDVVLLDNMNASALTKAVALSPHGPLKPPASGSNHSGYASVGPPMSDSPSIVPISRCPFGTAASASRMRAGLV